MAAGNRLPSGWPRVRLVTPASRLIEKLFDLIILRMNFIGLFQS